ncbi:MAG TPA: 3-deoxy-D-manno-octulosonic acid transferase [Candidatus Omnitrophota bacterium]|nr:3-deoxy-D-manno-octulosonic acid transferase [Candidatus Omnitrophota bacterium]
MRFGNIPEATVDRLKSKKNIWLHAVSVGEVLAMTDFIKQLKARYPRYQIVCTSVTKTGYALANQRLSGDCVVLYAPMDLSWVVGKFIRLIRPKVYIAAETEIWPNLYRALHRNNVAIIQVNGRISERSFRGYQRIKNIIRRILAKVDLFCVQSELDYERLIEIGAPKEKVHITGNIKFDNLLSNNRLEKTALGFSKDDLIVIAGSTHPREEEIVLNAFKKLQNEFGPLKLIISPRHIERSQEVAQLVATHGFKPLLYSALNSKAVSEKEIVVVDQIGILKNLYSIATVVFVGKSLAVGGGQNMIEPAFYGKPTIIGPLTYNFKDVVRIFLNEKAIVQIQRADELYGKMRELLEDQNKRQNIGANAKKVVEKYQGAGLRTLELVSPFFKE